MPISRNLLFLFIGALEVAIAALGTRVYVDHRQQMVTQFTFPAGIPVEKK